MNTTLTWHDKFRRITQLDSNASIKINGRGDWYISTNIHCLRDDGIIDNMSQGSARKTPEESVAAFWSSITDSGNSLILGLNDKVRYRWNGSLWKTI